MDPGSLSSNIQKTAPRAEQGESLAQHAKQVPKHLANTIFKGKKSEGHKSASESSAPKLPKLLTKDGKRGTLASAELDETPASPMQIPSSPVPGSHQKKLGSGSTFNNHYRSISKSMNDLIFSRGRSPPTDLKGMSPRRPSNLHTLPEGKKLKDKGEANVPSITVKHHEDQKRILKEDWLNVIESHSLKKGPIKDNWRLHQAIVYNNALLLYKPPSSISVKAFDIDLPPINLPRPSTAPSSAIAELNISTLRHKSTSRHPELVLGNDGCILGGTVEAICHEILFGESDVFAKDATLAMPAWTNPETGLAILTEYSTVGPCAPRIAIVLGTFMDCSFGLLLEPAFANAAKLLLEKGITPHNQDVAKRVRTRLDDKITQLKSSIKVPPQVEPDKDANSRLDHFEFSPTLPPAEFLKMAPEMFAAQLHYFHKEFLDNWHPASDLSLLLKAPHSPPSMYRNPLVFTTSNLHFISERVFFHLLTGDAVVEHSYRLALITHWLKIAQNLIIRGDFVGWLAIATALLAPSILRLQDTWSSVDSELCESFLSCGRYALLEVERWRMRNMRSTDTEPRVFGPEDIGFEVPQDITIPFFGDFAHCMDDVYLSRDRAINFPKIMEGIDQIQRGLKKWRKITDTLNQKGKDAKAPKHLAKPDEDYQRLFHSLNYANQNSPSARSATFFEMSLACEPSLTGHYVQSHYHERLPVDSGANLPLLFTEALPKFALFGKEEALAISGGSLSKKQHSSNLAPPTPTAGSQPHSPLTPVHNVYPHSTNRPHQPLRRIRSFPLPNVGPPTTGHDELDIATRERTELLSSVDKAVLGPMKDVAGVGQKIYHSKDEELVLKSLADANESRPSSIIENANKRASVASRRLSAQFQHANAASPRNSVHGSNFEPRPLSVVAKGGTLERLVDILVLGVEDFTRRMKRTNGNNLEDWYILSMDMNVFTITFFATFRSYCSPVVLLEYLKKRLTGAKSAAAAIANDNDDFVFPNWTGVDSINDDQIDWLLVAKIHIGILEALHLWVTKFFIDFHSDQGLTESFIHFMGIAAIEFAVWNGIASGDEELSKRSKEVHDLWTSLVDKFAKQIYTPLQYHEEDIIQTRHRIALPENGSIKDIDAFVDQLDVVARKVFCSINLVDWMAAFELLEVQSTDPLGFFLPKSSSVNDEDAVLQDVFYLFPRLKKVGGHQAVSLLSALPRPIREVFKLHSEIAEWALGQVVEPGIDADRRARRIVVLLRVLAVCRRRMANLDMIDKQDSTKRAFGVPSFLESAISAALVRPESRAYAHAWSNAVKDTVGPVSQIDTLEQVTPVLPPDDDSRLRPLVPCSGWIIERMLEIVCFVPNMLVESNRLINFDKRRYIYNLVSNLAIMANNETSSKKSRNLDVPSFALHYQMDRRAIRDTAVRENSLSKGGKIKVFWRTFYYEQEKLRRDKAQRSIIERHQMDLIKASQKRLAQVPIVDPPKMKSSRKIGVNTFIKAVRPISMALTNTRSLPHHFGRMISPYDLPPVKGLERSKKPNYAIDLTSLQSISCGKTTKQKLMWRLRAESGTSFLFQAPNEAALEEWLKLVSSIRGMPVSDGTAESIDALTMMSGHRIPQPVFGVPLSELTAREGTRVPIAVEMLLSEVEARGLHEMGIYRVGGSLTSIQALKAAFDNGEEVRMDDDRWYDINAVAGAFKLFIRELPEPLLSMDVLNVLKTATIEIGDAEEDEHKKVIRYREIFLQQPPHTYHFMRRLYTHLSLVEQNSPKNRMSAVNLAIVFGMGLAPEAAFSGGAQDLGIYQSMVKFWILNATEVFPPVDEDFPIEDLPSSDSSPYPSGEAGRGSHEGSPQYEAGPSGTN